MWFIFFCTQSDIINNFLSIFNINLLNAYLNSICHLLALLGAHHILHVSRIRVNILGNQCFFRIVSCGAVMLCCENKRTFRRDLLVSNISSDDSGGMHTERSVNFYRLQSVISQKAEFFIFTALITSSIAGS